MDPSKKPIPGIGEISKSTADENPFRQFEKWYHLAQQTALKDPGAMALATADEQGRPAIRMVLLRGLDEKGFVFYTNYQSRKGLHLEKNPFAALLFFWDPLQLQIRIEGQTERTDQRNSEIYFHTRPRGSQIAAYISPQSQVVESREWLEDKYHLASEKLTDKEIPRPAHWGGYRLIPQRFEFWVNRPNRLHDRIEYVLRGEKWEMQRLAP